MEIGKLYSLMPNRRVIWCWYCYTSARDEERIAMIEAYMKASKQFRDFTNADNDPVFSEVIDV